MSAVLKSNTGVSVAEAVLNDIVSRNSRYYYYLGKSLTWNPLGLDDPEVPEENYKYELTTRSQIVSTKRIKESDVSFVVRRYNWEKNVIYDMYDDSYSDTNLAFSGQSKLENCKFYVVTNEFNVYKCISNNYNSPSTVKPTGYDAEIFTTSDKYKWKFMYNIPIGFRNKFFESGFIPISNSVRNQFYSKGQIANIIIDNAGQSYVQNSTFINVKGDGYLEDNPYILNAINITDIGSGYTATPLAVISAPAINTPSKVQATGTVTLSGNNITAGTLTQIGFGYDSSADVSIDEPISGYVVWQIGLFVSAGQKIKHEYMYYNAVNGGLLGNSPPIHISGSVLNGSATLTFFARRARAILVSTKTEATITPIVNGAGEISGAVIANGGIGYSYANISIVGAGINAKLSVDLSVGDLNTLQSNVELLAVDGSLSCVKVLTNGTGYTTANIIIEGDGIGATADATLSSGKITDVVITNYGSGYTFATAHIVGNGTGCNIRAIISPKGGHGKNAILELDAKTLMFFTTISNEKNQGIRVDNDSRQLGIIKSLARFNSELSFKGDNGSSCYLLKLPAIVDQSKFFPDVKLNTGQKEYYIVSVEGDKMLIASLKNNIPIVGDTFTTVNLDRIIPTEITPPSVDKYSGTMLFIDNRNAFTTTSEQSLSLRTTIKF